MSTELFTIKLAFRGLSDDPEANDENTHMGEETDKDDAEDGLDSDGFKNDGDEAEETAQTME